MLTGINDSTTVKVYFRIDSFYEKYRNIEFNLISFFIRARGSNISMKGKIILIMVSAYIATNINLQGFIALFPFVREDFSLSRA